MAKFNVGDKVRVLKFDTRPWQWNGEGKMDKWMGKVVTILECVSDKSYRIKEDPIWMFNETHLEAEQPCREFIVLRRDGAKTIAELRHDREVIKSAVATCSEKDTFDFETGAKIAFDRLMGREEANKKSYIEREFKVGDRVITSHGVGEVVDVDHNETSMPYQILYDKGYKYWSNSGTAKPAPQPAHRFNVGDWVVDDNFGTGTIFEMDDVILEDIPYHVRFSDRIMWLGDKDLTPAPEPPKFYTGKVFAEKSLKTGYPSRNGKVFEFVDGKCINATANDCIKRQFYSFDEIREQLSYTKWHEVKSDV